MPLVSSQYLDAVVAVGEVSPRGRSGENAPRWLVDRIKHLDPKDRALAELHLAGATVRTAGRAVGMSSGSVSRRVATLMTRLNHPIVHRLHDEHCPLPLEHRIVGVEHFMLGRPAKWIAEHHRLSDRQVLAILDFLRAWHEGATFESRAGKGSQRRTRTRSASAQERSISESSAQ